MKLKFLGTGSCEGVPAMFCKCEGCRIARERGGKNIRTRSQAVIDGKLLIDFPSDSYLHVLYGGLDLVNIHSMLLTHAHVDHLSVQELSMRDMNKYCFGGEEGHNLTIYSSEKSGEPIREQFHNDFWSQHSGVVNQPIDPYKPYEIDGYTVTAVKASHAFEWDSYNYVIEKDGKSIFYAVDTGYFLEETWEYLESRKGAFDIIVLESSYLDAPGVETHMGIPDNIKVKDRLTQMGRADGHTQFYLTHMSHYRKPLHEETSELVAKYGIKVAYDYLEVEA